MNKYVPTECIDFKPTIVVDIDDTIVHFLKTLTLLYYAKMGRLIDVADFTRWDMKGLLFDTGEEVVIRGIAVEKFFKSNEHAIYNYSLPIHGAKTSLDIFKQRGYHVLGITSRPAKFLDLTREHIFKNALQVDEVIAGVKDKATLIDELNTFKYDIRYFIDDGGHHLKSVSEKCLFLDQVFGIEMPHNHDIRDMKNVTWVRDITGTVKYIL